MTDLNPSTARENETREPILVDCEGTHLPPVQGHCQMCGRFTTNVHIMPPHQRRDVLAMLDRGYFDS